MNGNPVSSTSWPNVTSRKWMLYGLHIIPTLLSLFHGLVYLWFWDTINGDNHKTFVEGSGFEILWICPSLVRWQITFISNLSFDPNSNIMEWPFWSPFHRWANRSQRMKGLEQSPQAEKLDLSNTAHPSKYMGWEKESVNTWGINTGKKWGMGAEKLCVDLPNPFVLQPWAVICAFLGTTLTHGIKGYPRNWLMG